MKGSTGCKMPLENAGALGPNPSFGAASKPKAKKFPPKRGKMPKLAI